MEKFELLHTAFDTLEITFQGTPGQKLIDWLDAKKLEAQDEENDVTDEFRGHRMTVAPTGGAGFKYRFQCGYDNSETWLVNAGKSVNGWSMRVSVGSAALAVDGVALVWDDIFQRLNDWGCFILAHSVGRVDVCADFAAPGFKLNPEAFVAHWRMTNKERADFDQADGVQIVRKGRKVTSVTMGMMPGRQIQIYDKRREVIDRQKGHWFEIWGVDRETEVWRVEIRLGKRHLKDVWNVSTMPELLEKLGDMLCAATSEIRYAEPGNDSNASRWDSHPLWLAAAEVFQNEHEPMGHAKKARVQQVRRNEQKEKYMRQVRGLLAGAAVCLGLEESDALPVEFARGLEWSIIAHLNEKREAFEKSKERAVSKFEFLESRERKNHACKQMPDTGATGERERRKTDAVSSSGRAAVNSGIGAFIGGNGGTCRETGTTH